MSDLPPDEAMNIAWDRSDGYEFQGRKLTWSRTHTVMAERIGLNIRRIGIILYVASLDAAGLRKARRNPDIAKDAACEIFEEWDIPMKGYVFDEAQEVALTMLRDVADSQTTTGDPNDEPNANNEKKTA